MRWKWKNSKNEFKVYVGLCNDPRHKSILKTKDRDGRVDVRHISISTTNANNGVWQFSSGNNKMTHWT